MRQLNQGAQIAAVGSSDSHAVAVFYFRRESFQSCRNGGQLPLLDQRGNRFFARVYGHSWNWARDPPAIRGALEIDGAQYAAASARSMFNECWRTRLGLV